MPKEFQPILDAILRQHPGIQDPVALIGAGRVFADGKPVTNPASRVAVDATITVRSPRRLRGTLKLQAALAAFDCMIAGRVALDVGASTGGFTVALLEAGARHVYALDAGHGQLLGSLRQDPRVTNLERTNLADLGPDWLREPVEVVTIDLSYLGIADAIPQLGALPIARDAELIALVKPMFELHLARPPGELEQLAAAVELAATAITAHGWKVVEELESSIRGGRGALEFFVHALRQMPRGVPRRQFVEGRPKPVDVPPAPQCTGACDLRRPPRAYQTDETTSQAELTTTADASPFVAQPATIAATPTW